MLADSVARLGAAPLITHYSPAGRIELSGITFSNWVMKTANLFDDLGGDVDEPVSLGVAETHPGHWVSLVWATAAWFAGARAEAGVPAGAGFVVVGPEDGRRGDVTVACSLHPFGRGFEQPPEDAVDFVEVLSQPDAGVPGFPEGASRAWEGVTFDQLNTVPGRADRRLFVEPRMGWEFLSEALVAPILGGGSSVLVEGLGEDEIERIRETEKIAPGS